MFAHNISPRQANCPSTTANTDQDTASQVCKTYLSIAVGVALACFSIQGHAASNGQVYNELPMEGVSIEQTYRSSQGAVLRLEDPMATTDNMEWLSEEFISQQTNLFLECTQVQTSAARLACYDKVADQGKTPSFTMNKQPVDLARTIKKTISGNPQFVLAGQDAEEGETTEQLAEQTASNERLDTIGLTKREAQVLKDVGVTQTDIERYTPLSMAYDLDQNGERGTWTARPHNPNYVLPLFYSFDPNLSPTSSSEEVERREYTPNEIRNTELKFQLSLKTKVAEDLFNTRSDLWFGYTQQAHWQVYNEDNSRPFRATDYQPEIFLTQPVTADLPFGGRLRMLGVGAVHHSNGRSDPISRSWNRAYLMGGAEWGKLSVIPRLWTRIKNESSDTDDNPDITDYMGHGDLTLLYDLPKQQSISSTLRYNTETKKGAAQIDYIYPLTKNVNGYVQLFHGYGESLIDYNHENTTIGVGIVLNDWKGF
ncbi:phospholipase A [Psychrobacter sp. H8-1]|uniref:phospholipase A n=1 Tax=Psychrobacter sp. H8-1 TaxID=2774129 RepID=UPI0019188328|nr:phospholipase A [Psychrobacter sp. H8-1]